jgi:predicted N-acetyltransferase YhbS
MGDLLIRGARDSDRDAIRELTLAAYQEYAALMPLHWEGYRQGILQALAEVKPAEQLVADLDGVIVGTVLLYPAGSVFTTRGGKTVTLTWPEIRLLAVAPSARGGGVGATLVRECIRRAQRSGAGALTLHTTDLMRSAMRLYERLSFVRAPELDFYPTPDFPVKGYRLQLDGGK